MAAVEHNNAAKVPSESGVQETVDYESDSDEGTSALALRRRVASDDEEEDDETNTATRDEYYDEDSEHHEGGPPVEEDEDEEEAKEEEEYEDAEVEGILLVRRKDTSDDYDNEEGIEEVSNHAGEGTRKPQDNVARGRSNELALEEKDTEPFVVPTAGAFYMHDDRFRYNGLARPRRSAGGRRPWEAKDEKPWVHDRFEELKLHDEGYSAQGVRGRRGRGRQGRVLGRGKDTERARGGKGNGERSFDSSLQSTQRRPGRGRGIRRAKMDEYEFKESRVTNNKFPPSSSHETTGTNLTALSMQNPASSQPITKPQDVTSKKPTISSMLKVSSPPFFPTGAALQNLSGIAPGTSKALEEKLAERDMGRLATRSGMEREMSGFSPASAMRPPSNPEFGTGLTHVSINGNVEVRAHRSMVRGSSTLQQQLTKTGSGGAVSEQRLARTEVSMGMMDQTLPGQSMQLQALVSPVLYPAKPAAMDAKKAPSPLGSNQGNGTVGRGTQALTMQGGRGSVAYGSGTLTNGLRGVVQFSGQQQAGLGVPTVGVALPGYASRPQFNFPNTSPEVTWIPILAGGGSLSSNYNPPYVAVDGGPSTMYYTQQASQLPAFAPSLGDLSSSKTMVKTPTRTEADDLGQQRRRYSQMTFGEERR